MELASERLSPIDRSLKTAWPVGQTAENRKTPSLARRTELLGTIALLCFLEDLAYYARRVDAC